MENYSPDFSRANAQLALMAQPTNGGYFTFQSEKDIIAENLRNHRGLYYSDNRGAAEREAPSSNQGDDRFQNISWKFNTNIDKPWGFTSQCELSESLGWGYLNGYSSLCVATSIMEALDLNANKDIDFDTKVAFMNYALENQLITRQGGVGMVPGGGNLYDFVNNYCEFVNIQKPQLIILGENNINSSIYDVYHSFGVGRSLNNTHSVIYNYETKSMYDDPYKDNWNDRPTQFKPQIMFFYGVPNV